MRGLRELVFSTTNQCPAHCRDCPVVSDSHPPARLRVEDMYRLIDEVYAWGSLELVVFTGGEAFLLGKDLRKAVAYAAQKKVSTRIVSNAYWATSKKRAVEVLGELKTLGLSEINFSCDDYHQQFIPLKRIKYANEAAVEVGLPALLVHRRMPGGQITCESLSEFLGVPLTPFKHGEKNPSNNVISSARNVPLDTSSAQIPSEPWEVFEDERDWMGACKSVLQSIVITSDLHVQICCGIALSTIPELCIGNLAEDDLLTILQRGNRDLITNWLALDGPGSILNFVREKDSTIPLPKQFVNRCHVCNEIFTRPEVRQVLREHAAERREALLVLRGALDWVGEDWAAAGK